MSLMLWVLICFSGAKSCDELYSWQYECEEANVSDVGWSMEHCVNNYWTQKCTVYSEIQCDGNRTVSRKKWCPCKSGASYSVALITSYLFGIFGVDRFYLGYSTYGFVKLFTCGLFFIGYLVDCFLITFQILKPADGSGYKAMEPFPFLQKSHRDIF